MDISVRPCVRDDLRNSAVSEIRPAADVSDVRPRLRGSRSEPTLGTVRRRARAGRRRRRACALRDAGPWRRLVEVMARKHEPSTNNGSQPDCRTTRTKSCAWQMGVLQEIERCGNRRGHPGALQTAHHFGGCERAGPRCEELVEEVGVVVASDCGSEAPVVTAIRIVGGGDQRPPVAIVAHGNHTPAVRVGTRVDALGTVPSRLNGARLQISCRTIGSQTRHVEVHVGGPMVP